MAPKVARFKWSETEHQQLSHECSVTPAPPDWRQEFLSDKDPLQLGRPLRVLIPCCGNDCGECFKHMGIDWELVGAFDLQEEYKSLIEHYVNLYGGGADLTGKLHLGKIEGDICNFRLEQLPDTDVIMSGPPCPPFSGLGKHDGQEDDRFNPFQTVLEWIVFRLLCNKLCFLVCSVINGDFAINFSLPPWKMVVPI